MHFQSNISDHKPCKKCKKASGLGNKKWQSINTNSEQTREPCWTSQNNRLHDTARIITKVLNSNSFWLLLPKSCQLSPSILRLVKSAWTAVRAYATHALAHSRMYWKMTHLRKWSCQKQIVLVAYTQHHTFNGQFSLFLLLLFAVWRCCCLLL